MKNRKWFNEEQWFSFIPYLWFFAFVGAVGFGYCLGKY